MQLAHLFYRHEDLSALPELLHGLLIEGHFRLLRGLIHSRLRTVGGPDFCRSLLVLGVKDRCQDVRFQS